MGRWSEVPFLVFLLNGRGTAGGGGDAGGPVDVHGGRVEGDASLEQQPAGGDQVVQHLVAVGEVLAAGGGFDEEAPQVLGGQELPAGVVQPGVVGAVGGDLGLELGDLVGGADDPVELAGGLQVADDAGVRRLVVEVPQDQHGGVELGLHAGKVPGGLALQVLRRAAAEVVTGQEGDVFGDGHAGGLAVLLALSAGGPVAGDDHQPVVGFCDLEDDLEDVAGGVAQVHQVRGLVDHLELAVVVGDGDVDAAQVGRWVGVGGDLEVGVAGVGQQLGEDVVAFDFGDAEQLGPVAVVQLVEYRGQVGSFGGVDLVGPAVGLGEFEVLRDGVVVGVEEVFQVPPGHRDRAHHTPDQALLTAGSSTPPQPARPEQMAPRRHAEGAGRGSGGVSARAQAPGMFAAAVRPWPSGV